ncbi:MAG: MFS transporter permease [Pseudomonadota bacterium]
MSQMASQQLDSIHSMLSAGQRNLRIERHTLLLWGLSCGAVILASDHILTVEQFPDLVQRAFAWLILLALLVSGVAMIDWHLTRRAKQVRDETWSFIHQQVLKVMWLLMAVGVLLTFAAFFFGGGYLIYAEWVVLFGVGLYVHGLFSEELLEWVGALLIAIGVSMVAFRVSYTDMQWIAASALGLGLPLLSRMLDRGRVRSVGFRLMQTVGWLLCVLLIPVLVHASNASGQQVPEVPVVSLEAFRQQPYAHNAVVIPRGTVVPVKVDVSGDLFRTGDALTFPLQLEKPVLVMMNEGKPTGEMRVAGGDWVRWQDTLTIHIPRITAEYDTAQGAVIRSTLIVNTRDNATH